MSSQIQRMSAYRPDIDGLRAVAVLAVVGFHAFPRWLPGGFVGVDVFFVISGSLISSIIFAHLSRSDFTLREFYARRARRILPALCLVLACCLAFGFYALLPDEFRNLGKHTAAAAGFAANIAFWRESGYFAPSAQFEPLLHLWSLGIEEQFYLLWPLLVIAAWRMRFNLLLIVSMLTAASLALSIALAHAQAAGNYYLPLSRFWELGLGCLLATIRSFPAATRAAMEPIAGHGVAGPFGRIADQLPLLGIALIAAGVFAFDEHTAFPGAAALLPTAGALCVIAAPAGSWFRERVLSHPSLVFIGLVSYPLYLWHWPILSFGAILHSGTPQVVIRSAALLLSLFLAVLTYRFVELPVRERRRPRVSLALAGTAAALGSAGVAIYAHDGLAGRFDANVREIAEVPSKDSLCLDSVPNRSQFNYCRRTSPQQPQVVFLGDSQAQGVYEGVSSTLGRSHSMLLLGRGGCPPVLDVRESPGVYDTDANRRSCNETWRTFVSYVRQNRPPMVVLVGAGSRFFHAPGLEDGSESRWMEAENDAQAFEDGLGDLVRALQPYSRVVYMLEIPTFNSAPECFLRPVKFPGTRCSPRVRRSSLTARRTAYRTSVLEVQRRNPGLTVIDPIPSLCTGSACSQISRSGEVLYRDEMHLSPAGGRRLAQRSGLIKVIEKVTPFETHSVQPEWR